MDPVCQHVHPALPPCRLRVCFGLVFSVILCANITDTLKVRVRSVVWLAWLGSGVGWVHIMR